MDNKTDSTNPRPPRRIDWKGFFSGLVLYAAGFAFLFAADMAAFDTAFYDKASDKMVLYCGGAVLPRWLHSLSYDSLCPLGRKL